MPNAKLLQKLIAVRQNKPKRDGWQPNRPSVSGWRPKPKPNAKLLPKRNVWPLKLKPSAEQLKPRRNVWPLKLKAERRMAEERAAAERQAEQAQGQMASEREAAEAEAERIAAEAEAERMAAEAEAERMAAEAEAERAAAEAEAERMAAEAEAERQRLSQQRAQATAAPAVPADQGDFILARTPENIRRLGNDLTPMGSIRAGSGDGRIPAWDGGLTREDWPAGYEPGDRHLDPFASDQPLYVITGENYREYADRLSVGQMATFERYPDTYKMAVYPTRRSASFPQFVYDASIRNASTGRLTAEGEGVADVSEGFPFPLPQNAYELIWNHKLKYKGTGGVR